MAIKIYADESVNVAIVAGLKRRGINAFSAKDLGRLGLTDDINNLILQLKIKP
jgi:hypothetical protein